MQYYDQEDYQETRHLLGTLLKTEKEALFLKLFVIEAHYYVMFDVETMFLRISI